MTDFLGEHSALQSKIIARLVTEIKPALLNKGGKKGTKKSDRH
jgi:hypothetical protein